MTTPSAQHRRARRPDVQRPDLRCLCLEGTARRALHPRPEEQLLDHAACQQDLFKAESWFKGDDFFTEQTNLAENFAKDPGTLNDGYPV